MNFPFSNFQFSIKTPKVKMAIVLLVLATLAIVNSFSGAWQIDILLRLVVVITSTLILEFVLWKARGVTPFLPSAGLVTALIIFLLADPESPVHFSMLAVLVAVGLKQFLRPANNHIFNPAASGLLIASLFGLPITWWGVAASNAAIGTFNVPGWGLPAQAGNVPLLVTIIGAGFVSLFTIRQHRIILSFLVTSIVVSTLYLGNIGQSINQLLVGSFWFFTLVMLPEPMTAAKLPNTRILYGIVVASLPFLFAKTIHLSIEPLLAALLLGNFLFRIIEEFQKSSYGDKS